MTSVVREGERVGPGVNVSRYVKRQLTRVTVEIGFESAGQRPMHRDTYFIVPVHVKSCEPKACAQSAEMSLLNSQSYSQPRLTAS